MELLLSDEVRPFAIAAAALLGLVAVELAALLVGFSVSDAVESSMGLDSQTAGGGDAEGGLAGAWNWLNVGGLPLLVLIMLGLGTFAALGIALQQIAEATTGRLPLLAAVPLVLLATVPCVRAASRLIGRIIPREETYAVELADLVGRIGEVAVGPLDHGLPGSVRLKDGHGNWHTVRARAAKDADAMPFGSAVLLVDRIDAIFLAIPLPAVLGSTEPTS